jgi:hypothetical protein
MSEFIEHSKHRFTSTVEDHILRGKKPDLTGEGEFVTTSPGALPAGNKPMPFPAESGTNYTPPDKAGHTVK